MCYIRQTAIFIRLYFRSQYRMHTPNVYDLMLFSSILYFVSLFQSFFWKNLEIFIELHYLFCLHWAKSIEKKTADPTIKTYLMHRIRLKIWSSFYGNSIFHVIFKSAKSRDAAQNETFSPFGWWTIFSKVTVFWSQT